MLAQLKQQARKLQVHSGVARSLQAVHSSSSCVPMSSSPLHTAVVLCLLSPSVPSGLSAPKRMVKTCAPEVVSEIGSALSQNPNLSRLAVMGEITKELCITHGSADGTEGDGKTNNLFSLELLGNPHITERIFATLCSNTVSVLSLKVVLD